MKKLVLTGLLAIPGMLHAQGPFTLEVRLPKNPGKVYLRYFDSKLVVDSAVVTGGIVRFKGTVSEPQMAYLGYEATNPDPKANKTDLFLEKGAIHVKVKESFIDASITGPANTMDYVAYKNTMRQPLADYTKASAGYFTEIRKTDKNEQQVARLLAQKDSMSTVYKQVQKNFIMSHPDSYVSPMLIREIAAGIADLPVVEPLFNVLTAKPRSSRDGLYMNELIEKKKLVLVGKTAPEFTQNDVNDQPVKLSDFRGKYVLLDFWASWCVPCRKENPFVVKAYNAYKDKGFTVISISLDGEGKKEAWLAAIEKDGLTWTNVCDFKFFKNEVAVKYGIKSIPQNFLLDKEGKIVATNLYGEELDKKLRELMD